MLGTATVAHGAHCRGAPLRSKMALYRPNLSTSSEGSDLLEDPSATIMIDPNMSTGRGRPSPYRDLPTRSG